MTVLVLGGLGFVGCHIVETLMRLDPACRVIAADAAAPDAVVGALMARHRGRLVAARIDIRDREALHALVASAQPQTIVHGAAVTPTPADERSAPLAVADVNLGGTVNVLAATAAAQDRRRLVFLSSTAVYGPAAAGGEIDETVQPRPDKLYAITKRAGEDLVRRWGELTGVEAVILRLGGIFGRFERPTASRTRLSAVARLAARAHTGAPVRVFGGDVRRDWLCGEDLGAAVAAVVKAPEIKHDLYHVAGPSLAWREVVDAFVACGLQAQWVEDPGSADLALLPGDARPSVSAERLARDVGFRPRTPLHEAVAALVATTASRRETVT